MERSTDADVAVVDCLHELSTVTEGLVALLRTAPDSAWEASTVCDPWRVRDIVVHLVIGGERFCASIDAGRRGSLEPGGDRERARHQAALERAEPDAVLAALAEVTDEFASRYDGADEAALATVCFHRRGNRSVRWYAAQRLAEVAFHTADIELALGRGGELRERTARLLLPALIESNLPRTYSAGLSAERGHGERYALAPFATALAWTVQLDDDEMVVDRGVIEPDLVVMAAAPTIASLVYGRRDLGALVADGTAQVHGPPALVERFGALFPRP